MSRSNKSLVFLNLLALAGVGISVALTQHFYDLHSGALGFGSYCNLGGSLNCDVVAASPYSELAFGLPISSFSAGLFLALFFVSLFAYNPFWKRETTRVAFGLTSLATFFSLVYLLIMAVRLKTYCLLCLGVDLVSLTSLLAVFSMKPEGFSKHPLDRSKWKILLGIVATSVILTVGSLKLLDQTSISNSDLNEMVKTVLDSPPVAMKTDLALSGFGPKDAPITIVEFSDFQCPFCRIGAFTVNSVVNRFAGKIRVIFRNFPLDQGCNSAMKQTMHAFACEAAKAAICANRIGKFEPLYQQLFEKQATLGPGVPLKLAKDLGLDTTQLEGCISSSDTTSSLAKDVDEGILLGVASTPTFFINGYKMMGVYPFPVWIKVIEKLLSK